MVIKIGLAVLLASAQWAELAANRMAEEVKPMLKSAAGHIHWIGVNTEAQLLNARDYVTDKVASVIWG